MGKWSDLTAQQKAAVIKFAMDNGVSDINGIRDTYNLYSSGFENVYKDGGNIHIKPSKRGTFTAAATKHGKSVQEFARQVLANPENYSPAMRKKAQFAHNAASWKHSTGGPLYPFSFEKNPYWKTPVVRYDDGGFIDALKSLYRKVSNSTQQTVNNIVAKEHSYVGLPTTDNRPYNPDYMSYIEKGLTGRGINGNRLPALLGTIAEESGGNPFAISSSGKYQGLVQWGKDRYVIPDTTIDPYQAIDLQLDTLVSTLRNSKDKTSWTHGGTGSGYNSKMEPFNEFWNDTTSIAGATKALNLGYIRPGGKHASVANRTRVAQHIGDTVLKR